MYIVKKLTLNATAVTLPHKRIPLRHWQTCIPLLEFLWMEWSCSPLCRSYWSSGSSDISHWAYLFSGLLLFHPYRQRYAHFICLQPSKEINWSYLLPNSANQSNIKTEWYMMSYIWTRRTNWRCLCRGSAICGGTLMKRSLSSRPTGLLVSLRIFSSCSVIPWVEFFSHWFRISSFTSSTQWTPWKHHRHNFRI